MTEKTESYFTQQPQPSDSKEIIKVEFSIGNPITKDGLKSDTENLYKKTIFSDGTFSLEEVILKKENKEETKETNDKEETVAEKPLPKVDLNADSDNSHISTITDYAYALNKENVLSNVKKINQQLDHQWKKNAVYLALTKQEQERIEHNNDMKKMYRYIALDNVSGVNTLITKGRIKPEEMNSNGGLALQLSISTGSVRMTDLLLRNGANPSGIDPKQCHNKEMEKLIEKEQYNYHHNLSESIGTKTLRF